MKLRVACLALTVLVAGCSVWPVDQDPNGMEYRRNANAVIDALQAYHRAHGAFPAQLADLAPTYLAGLPDEPVLTYHPASGSVEYRFIPSFPQLRPVRCTSVGDTTEWRCAEHIL